MARAVFAEDGKRGVVVHVRARAHEEGRGANGRQDAEVACVVGDEPNPPVGKDAHGSGGEGRFEVREVAVVDLDLAVEQWVDFVFVVVFGTFFWRRGLRKEG